MTDDEPTREIQSKFGLAHGWLRLGRPDRAAAQLVEIIELDPTLDGPFTKLAELYVGLERWDDAIEVCERGLARFPDISRLHKTLTTALIAVGGHQAAEVRYRLERVDDRPVDIGRNEIIATLVVRNEIDRLPWFMTECRQLGVGTFLVVDNGSTDGSVEWLLDQSDVRLWHTAMSFNAGNFGSAWFEVILRRHGVGHWVLMLDADEVICFPGSEHRSLGDFCVELTAAGADAATGLLIDMYSDRPLSEVRYVPGDAFVDHCPFFDRQPYHEVFEADGPFRNLTYFYGGMRKRRFGDGAAYLVTKVPLLRYDHDVVLAGGQHWTSHPAEHIAQQTCAVLHFKYFASFVDYARQEAERKEHSQDGLQYSVYARGLRDEPDAVFHDPDASVRYSGSRQLVELDLVRSVADATPGASASSRPEHR